MTFSLQSTGHGESGIQLDTCEILLSSLSPDFGCMHGADVVARAYRAGVLLPGGAAASDSYGGVCRSALSGGNSCGGSSLHHHVSRLLNQPSSTQTMTAPVS